MMYLCIINIWQLWSYIVYHLLNISHYSSIKILCNNYDVFILELCRYCVQPAIIPLEP